MEPSKQGLKPKKKKICICLYACWVNRKLDVEQSDSDMECLHCRNRRLLSAAGNHRMTQNFLVSRCLPLPVCVPQLQTRISRCLLKASDCGSLFTEIALFCSNVYFFKGEYSPNQQLELKACLLSLLCLASAGWSNYTRLKKEKRRENEKKHTFY